MNFDQAINELRQRGHRFRLFGDDYILPASISALAALEFQRLAQRASQEHVDVVALFDAIFHAARPAERPDALIAVGSYDADGTYQPSDVVRTWLNLGLPTQTMTDMLVWALRCYGLANNEETGSGPLPAKSASASTTS